MITLDVLDLSQLLIEYKTSQTVLIIIFLNYQYSLNNMNSWTSFKLSTEKNQ